MRTMPSRRRLGAAACLLAVPIAALPVPAAASQQAVFEQVYVTNSASRAPATAPGSAARFQVEDTGKMDPLDTVEAGRGARGMVFASLNAKRFAYVTSELSPNRNDKRTGRIDRYEVAPDGTLHPLGSTPADRAFGLGVGSDGRTIYVSHFEDDDGPTGNGSLSAYRVGDDGGLTLINTVDSGTNHPKFLALAPNGRFLYVASGTPDAPVPGLLTGYAIESDGSIGKTPIAQEQTGESGHRVAITPDGRFVYVSTQESGGDPDIYGFRIGLDGGLTKVPGTPVESGVWTEGVAVSPDGKRLYVVALGVIQPLPEPPVADGEVRWFTIGTDGRLTEAGKLAFGNDTVDLAFGWNGERLYISDFSGRVLGQGRGTVSSFAVDTAGNLRHVHTVLSQGVDPAGQSVFVPPRITPL